MGTWRALFCGADFLLGPYTMEGARELCRIYFIRISIPFMRAPPSIPKFFPQDTITLGIRISTNEKNFWGRGHKNIQTIALMMPISDGKAFILQKGEAGLELRLTSRWLAAQWKVMKRYVEEDCC